MDLQQWMSSIGLSFEPILDNKIHRCDEFGTKKSDHIWYIGSVGVAPSGKERTTLTVGNHRTGEQWYYSSGKASEYSQEDKEHYARKQKEASEKAEEEKRIGQERAAAEAERIWAEGTIVEESHDYLRRKQIPKEVYANHIKQRGGELLIPMRDISGKLWGIQRIFPDGTKRFLTGQRTSGCSFKINGLRGSNKKIAICEGFATAASIHNATGYETYAVFSASNITKCAMDIRGRNAEIPIIICGDDDRWGGSGKNIGREKAIEAANAVGGVAVFPDFSVVSIDTLNASLYPETLNLCKPTDFNDLMVLEGIDEVRRQIEGAIGRGSQRGVEAIPNVGRSSCNNNDKGDCPDSNRDNSSDRPDRKDDSRSKDHSANEKGEKEASEVVSTVDKELVFPDKEKKRLKGTIENLQVLLEYLGVIVRYNVISKEEEILIPSESFTKDNRANATYAIITSWCNRVGLPIGNLTDHLSRLADKNLYNPVDTWIRSREWDGVSRLDDMFNTVDSPTKLKKLLMRKWFISAVAALYEPNGISAHGVLVFKGAQYIGKTKWFKNLAPVELNVMKDGAILHPDNKDSVFQIITKWLVELGELDATFRKADIAQLKAFITKDEDVVRRAYARKESHYARRTVFFASVNEHYFLNDPTGNRRFWTIECNGINYDHGIDMQQFWAEVMGLYKKGETWLLSSDEVRELNDNNESFQQMDSIEETIRHSFNWDDVDYPSWLSATQVCQAIDIPRPTNQECKRVGAALRKLIKQKPKTIDGLVRFPVPPRVISQPTTPF